MTRPSEVQCACPQIETTTSVEAGRGQRSYVPGAPAPDCPIHGYPLPEGLGARYVSVKHSASYWEREALRAWRWSIAAWVFAFVEWCALMVAVFA